MKKLVVILSPLVLLIIGILIFLFKENSQRLIERDYPDIAEANLLRVVTSIDPIGYFVSSDSISGYNYEMLTTLEKYSGINFEIHVENNLNKCFEELKTGKYDLIARNISINSDLKSEYSFTEPTVYNKHVLIQRKAEYNNQLAPLRDRLQLGRRAIYVPKGSPSILRLRNLSHEIGDTIFIMEDPLYETTQLAMMVAAGDIDFSVCDIKTAQKLAAKNPELDIKTDIGFTHFEAWAVRSNSPILKDSLNIWIDRFKSTKKYSLILRKYYK